MNRDVWIEKTFEKTFRNYFHFFATSMLVTLSSTKYPKIVINSLQDNAVTNMAEPEAIGFG